jgi:tripartite-type tricarboxylate transporter receptor subunit TctC
MFNRRQFMQGAAGAVAGSGLVSVPALADISYPDRPIHVIIGFPAGSGADILCRWYTRKLEELCGQAVIMDNKPGASGNIATRYAARATPDGYTISLISNSSMVGAKFLFKDLQFDAVKDFMPIATFAQIGFVLVVSPKSPLKTVADLTARLKEKKDNIFGYTNPTGLLSAELYKQLAGVPAKGVSYRTAPDTMRDLTDGTLDFMFMDGTFAAGQVRQETLKALAVVTPTRVATFPDVPTMKETGLNFNFAPWWAAWAPTGTPQPVVDKLEMYFRKIADMPETTEFLKTIATNPQKGGQKETAERLLAEFEIWPPLVKAAGLMPE